MNYNFLFLFIYENYILKYSAGSKVWTEWISYLTCNLLHHHLQKTHTGFFYWPPDRLEIVGFMGHHFIARFNLLGIILSCCTLGFRGTLNWAPIVAGQRKPIGQLYGCLSRNSSQAKNEKYFEVDTFALYAH